MIKTGAAMLKALRRNAWRGVILYEGPSLLDGAPIVVVANRITTASDNSKTGDMVQTFVIRSDVDPVTALRTGADAAVCGDCPHRPANKGSCYVNVGRSVRSVFNAYKRERYARPGVDYDPAILPSIFAGLVFRLGTYGDPTAAPYQIWRRATLLVKARNGYSHQWRQKRFAAFRFLCMASVDSLEEMFDAQAAGWRTFRVRAKHELVSQREFVCPASQEAGKRTTCEHCQACGGLSAKAKASPVIIAHGATANRFERRIAA